MRWFGAPLFFRTLVGTRVIWFAGRFGGGKTLLSFAVAEWLYRHHYIDHVVSNIPSSMTVSPGDLRIRDRWADGVPDGAASSERYDCRAGSGSGSGDGWRPGMANTAIVFDEAWILLDARDWQRNVGRTIGAYLRKFNLFLLLPSVFSVDARFRRFSVQRVLNMRAFGVPCWVYKWSLSQGKIDENGLFALWRPSGMFGRYDNLAAPADDGGILAAMQDTVPDVVTTGADGAEYTGDVDGYGTLEKRGGGRGGRGR
jgi:hypothetical protein